MIKKSIISIWRKNIILWTIILISLSFNVILITDAYIEAEKEVEQVYKNYTSSPKDNKFTVYDLNMSQELIDELQKEVLKQGCDSGYKISKSTERPFFDYVITFRCGFSDDVKEQIAKKLDGVNNVRDVYFDLIIHKYFKFNFWKIIDLK